MWSKYEIELTASSSVIADPIGRTIDLQSPGVVLLWRKPFVDQMEFDGLNLKSEDEAQAKEQLAQWLHAVAALFRTEGRLRLVEPYADRRLPKLYQLRLASSYFDVPPYIFGIDNEPPSFGPDVIAKPLGIPGVGSKKIWYTKRVDSRDLLRPYPWFLQAALVGGTDVTCVHICGENHFFECAFARDAEAIDWRTEINAEDQAKWTRLNHPKCESWGNSATQLMREMNLKYGRLDFILIDGILYFLECNSNGQFGWLDISEKTEGSYPLHEEFLSCALAQESVVI